MKRAPSRELVILVVIVLVAYVLSSGPVLAISFWLREATGWDGFYAVLYLYLPLFLIPGRPLDPYIEWCVWILGTAGPG